MEKTKRKSVKNIVFIVLAVVLALLIAVTCYIFFSDSVYNNGTF